MATSGKKRIEKGIGKIHVMEKLLIYIKHRFAFLWSIIEWVNDRLFFILFSKKLERCLAAVFKEFEKPSYLQRKLNVLDASALIELINYQEKSDIRYFRPHDFDLISIKKQLNKKSFLMMGVFDGSRLIGYFFLRFFVNGKCFVGRLTDRNYRGKGVGKMMNTIMYETAWQMGFRCLSTISKNNNFVLQAHKHNTAMLVLKELSNDFLLVEFVRPD